MNALPETVQALLSALEPLGGTLYTPEEQDDPWTVEITGWMRPGVYQADLDEDGTFSVWHRNWDRTGALSAENQLDEGLAPEQAALVLSVIWSTEKSEHDKLEALMAASDAALEAEERAAAERPWES